MKALAAPAFIAADGSELAFSQGVELKIAACPTARCR